VTCGVAHDRPLASLPALVVEVATDGGETVSAEMENEFGAVHIRRLPVTITAMVYGGTTYLDALDLICLEVETAIHAATALTAMVKRIGLESTEISMSGEGETPVAVAVQRWAVLYAVDETAPSAALT
jgi:hypothetical protein